MGNMEFQIGDQVRLREGLEIAQGVLAGQIGQVTWVEPPGSSVGSYRVKAKFADRELETFDTDLVLVE